MKPTEHYDLDTDTTYLIAEAEGALRRCQITMSEYRRRMERVKKIDELDDELSGPEL